MFRKKRSAAEANQNDVIKSKNPGSAAVTNPYLEARREWDERYGDLVSRETTWKVFAMLEGLALVLSVAGLVYVSSQSQIKPYIVQVDSFGRQVGGGFVSQSANADEAVKKATLTRFVYDMRSVVSDGVIQRQMIDRVYAHIASGSAAQTQVSDFYRNDPPQQRARTQIVSVEVVAAFAPSPTTYEIEWIETTRDAYGKVLTEVRWRGSFSIKVSPNDQSAVTNNPLGIYVTNVAWSRVNR